MRDRKLFKLAEKKYLHFNKLKNLKSFIEEILDENLSFPMVVGHEPDHFRDDWKIRQSIPINNKTILTINNYLEGLNELIEVENNYWSPKLFKGKISYDRIDTKYSNHKFAILTIDAIQKIKHFELKILYEDHSHYSAHSCIWDQNNNIEDICRKYVGPNMKEN